MLPLVSIITVNFRQAEVTCELLNSLREVSYANLEVILVDNGSVEDNREIFKQCYPELKLIVSKENLGFAGGNNLGIREAKGDFLFFINNDTEVSDGLIENLLARFSSPKIGAVSPKIRYYHSPKTIQYAGFTPVNPLTGRNAPIGKGEKDAGQHDIARSVPYAHGAAMMIRREVIKTVGEMPEAFFLYYEELDWCEQIRRAGYEIWYEPSAMILHKESVSTGKDSPLKKFYMTRNRILFMRRNFSGLKLVIFLVFFFGVSVPTNALRLFWKRDFELLKAFIRGCRFKFQLNPKPLQAYA